MPHQLEGFQLASRARFNPKPLVWMMLLAVLVGSISSFWAYLHDVYHFGAAGGFARHPFNRLQQNSISHRTEYSRGDVYGHGNGIHISADVFTDAFLLVALPCRWLCRLRRGGLVYELALDLACD